MLLKRGGKDMIKQIRLKIEEQYVIANMNEIELFRISSNDKTIDIYNLYKKMAISKEDILENLIEDIQSQNKTILEILYENTKIFLDELIEKINGTLVQFDSSTEEKILINQQ